ncbi:fimbrial protein [Lonsdalea quercina]|uniref:Type 1 fimbrial protein n=1 Tax=Lonsdalea quercina TaxID=71657 RepID=A0A1H4DE67_9GAMM|nr:fimbrial protein [Lonsdalea quercina]SEA70709.1 type 1 fimbrial protein [Lonsdalea quercina]
MKKNLLTLSVLVASLGVTGLARATDGVINFTATISSSACSVNSVADASSTTGTVNFGTVSSSTFGTAGASTVGTPFSIELADCAVATAPTITFEGTSVSTSGYTELFASDISGLGIRIEDADNTGTYYTSGTPASNTGFNVLTSTEVTSATGNFNAYLVDYTGSTAYSGSVDTDVTFTINYSDS